MSETKTEGNQTENQVLPEFRAGFHPEKAGTLIIELDLDRMNPAWARGCLLTADDIVKNWYLQAKQVKKDRGITIAQSMHSLKNMVLGRSHGK